MKRRIAICLLAAVIAVAFIPATAFGASKAVKNTTYDQVIKSGKTVYCSAQSGIYKVTIKKGKAKKVKTLKAYPNGAEVAMMKKKGKYLYFNEGTGESDWALKRMKASNGKSVKTYATSFDGKIYYAIKGKKIYFELMEAKWFGDDWDDIMVDYEMKLTGKTKKESKKYPKVKEKITNSKKYKVIEVKTGSIVKCYLKTPKGQKYLGQCTVNEEESEE